VNDWLLRCSDKWDKFALLTEVHTVNRCRQSQRGFTLIELFFVIAIALIITGMALVQFVPVLKSSRAENALQTTLGQVRNARGLAIDQRRKYRLSFLAPRTIQLDQVSVDPVTKIQSFTFISTIDLPLDTQFIAISGIPTSGNGTPDSLPTFGNAIDFAVDYGGGGTQIFFQPDGRVLDSANRLNNGVVYVARPGELMSSRAVSVLGATGRVKGWRLIQSGSTVVWWRFPRSEARQP
jgi:prepilin-type N-terminal cleavage/methylation domain-containing protein